MVRRSRQQAAYFCDIANFMIWIGGSCARAATEQLKIPLTSQIQFQPFFFLLFKGKGFGSPILLSSDATPPSK